ncbi:hypothetical protein FNV43_RR03354 [Rhamnella rubrinervis]|uniref:Uncharacterized protein n=1 Tax=Rhamnella rubrinervis TaxID=2594499 RepID=A0A8K0HI93_9ROSA|nr:hypothetical protein FNV43_RR03354 [Rhamnella rubrinervis]
MESKNISLVMVVAAMVILATTFGPLVFVDGRDLYVIDHGVVINSGTETDAANNALTTTPHRTALFNIMMQTNLKGTGDKCSGGFCMFSPMSCAPGCGCLYPAGVCYGTCCE